MKKIKKPRLRLALVGATGRMGKNVIRLLEQDEIFKNKFELVWAGSLRKPTELKNLTQVELDVLIDFSKPLGTLLWTSAFKKNKKLPPCSLICATGFSQSEIKKLNLFFGKRNWSLSANTSQGIASVKQTVEFLATQLDSAYHFSIIESHHKHKIDAPSGTALMLKNSIEKNSSHKVETFSIRGGTDPGTHRVIIVGPHEKIEIVHVAEDRKLFAHGALMKAWQLAISGAKK